MATSALPFATQLDELTDIAGLSRLLAYIRYVSDASIKIGFLFCRPSTTINAISELKVISDFFAGNNVSWTNLVDVYTDVTSAMTGSCSGYVASVKLKNPRIRGTHYLLH